MRTTYFEKIDKDGNRAPEDDYLDEVRVKIQVETIADKEKAHRIEEALEDFSNTIAAIFKCNAHHNT
ncbi:MAG: hypothetical protein IJV66_03100 [Firmicutes bacterium]|nr:hypothetical protein [Bacillota bacterium]